MSTTARQLAMLLGGLLVAVSCEIGCGSETSTSGDVDLCPPDTIECLSGDLARICPYDGSGWLALPCAGGCSGAVCDQGTQGCTPGAAECIDDRLARVCPSDGSAWLAMACGASESCTDGSCIADVVPPLCTALERQCAAPDMVKVCDLDGEAWFYLPCGPGETCFNGTCAVDVAGGLCRPGERFCSDAVTAWQCNPGGAGYAQVNCPAGTVCAGGDCVGPACTVGEKQCAGTVIRDCTDGTQWVEQACAPGEICVQIGTDAQCQDLHCIPDQQACGNPDDGSVSQTDYYAQCALNQLDGSLHWVTYQCSAPATCDPARLNQDPPRSPCGTACVPGSERCVNQNLSYEVCDANGNWGAPIDCNAGPALEKACMRKPQTNPLAPTEVACADLVCQQLAINNIDNGGVCAGGEIRRCDADGQVPATSTPCAEGVCVDLTGPVGGYPLGVCVVQCQPGEEICVSSGQSPLYRDCVGGAWSTAYQPCAGDATCVESVAGGMRAKLCDPECNPGESRCAQITDPDDAVEICNAAGRWEPVVGCALGRCRVTSVGARCLADCEPGAAVCVGTSVVASDGLNFGTTEEGACTGQGLLPQTGTACTGTHTCRTSALGEVLGCVECLGTAVAGGNAFGQVDNRCSAAARDELETCTAANTWGTTQTCTAGSSCEVDSTTCAQCVGGDCTETYLQTSFSVGCSDLGLGMPTLCGGYPDCCSSFCVGSPGPAHCVFQ